MNSLPLLFLLLGMFFILVGYFKFNKSCPPAKIEYRYIPRTFYNEQMSPGNVQQTFNTMFSSNTAWMDYPLGTYSSNTNTNTNSNSNSNSNLMNNQKNTLNNINTINSSNSNVLYNAYNA